MARINIETLVEEQAKLAAHLEKMREHLFTAKLGDSDKVVVEYINREMYVTENKLNAITDTIEAITNEDTI